MERWRDELGDPVGEKRDVSLSIRATFTPLGFVLFPGCCQGTVSCVGSYLLPSPPLLQLSSSSLLSWFVLKFACVKIKQDYCAILLQKQKEAQYPFNSIKTV